MAKILNKCPICGGRLQYHHIMQFTEDYKIKLDGTLSKQFKKSDSCSMECGFISCTFCDFHTNCDLEVKENHNIKIYQEHGVYMYENKEKGLRY